MNRNFKKNKYICIVISENLIEIVAFLDMPENSIQTSLCRNIPIQQMTCLVIKM